MKKKFFLKFLIILFILFCIIALLVDNKSNAADRSDGVIYFDTTLLTQSLPGSNGTITYVASSSARDIFDKISGTMIQDSSGENIYKTDQDIPVTYDYIQFYYTTDDGTKEYTSGLLTIDDNYETPCFYSYAFLSVQQSIAEQIEYQKYYLDATDLEAQTLEAPLEAGIYGERTTTEESPPDTEEGTNDTSGETTEDTTTGESTVAEEGEIIADTTADGETATEGDTTENEDTTTLPKPFTINADLAENSRDIVIEERETTLSDGTILTKKIRLRGRGTSEYRSVSFESPGSFDITIAAIAASSTADRTIAVYGEDGKIVEKLMVSASTNPIQTFTIDRPGKYYVASVNSGIDLGYITVSEYYTPIFKGGWNDLNKTNTPQQEVNDIEQTTYTKDNTGSTSYIKTNIYDYYSDWELTGNSLYDLTYEDAENYYYFQGNIFNHALSKLFESIDPNKTSNVLYFGALGKTEATSAMLSTLYNSQNRGNTSSVSAAIQGLIETVLNTNKKATSGGIELPYFDKAFLEGNNDFNTTLGKVYENVDFPFVLNEETGYWEFQSSNAEETIRLKQDSTTSEYYLDRVGADEAVYRNDTPGFYPLTNSTVPGRGAESKKNNMFGFEMVFDFTLTEDGKINFYDSEGNIVKKDIVFNFSGDDDVWIFIDDNLILDIGGTHQEIAGTIDFATGYSAVTYTTTDGTTAVGNADIETFELATQDGISADSIVTEDGNTYFVYNDTRYTASSFNTADFLDGQTHTLKMFYMERGTFGTNMRISYNFPISDSVSIQNTVDTSNVNEIFKDLLLKIPDFEFEIKTMATIGEPLPVENIAGKVGFETEDSQISDYNSISDTNTSNGLQPVYGITYDKISSTGNTEELTITDGKTIVNNGEKVTFTDSFRTGSYIQIIENLNDSWKNIFETTWKIKQDDSEIQTAGTGESITTTGVTLSGTGYVVNDNRGPSESSVSVTNIVKPTDGSIVYRSMLDPDMASQYDLQIEYVNTLQVGSITLEKQVTGDNPDSEYEYEFLVEFTNVAGNSLETETVSQTVKLKNGQTATISGIPLGTEYKITEVMDISFEGINIEENIHSDILIEDSVVTGKVAKTGENSEQKIKYINSDITKGYGKIEITKVDKYNNDKKLANAIFKIEKLIFDETSQEWIIDTNFTEVQLTTDENGFASLESLDFGKYRISEIQAPEGYNLAEDYIETEINIDNLTANFTITNKSKTVLPSAGAIGLYIVPCIGILIISIVIIKISKGGKKRKCRH